MPWQILTFLTGLKTISDHHMVGKQNVEVMKHATNTIFTLHAVDRRGDSHTGAFQYNLSDDIDITKTGNFLQRQEKFLNNGLVSECNWLIIWILRISYVMA